MFFCQDVTDHCTLAGRADSPLFICFDHSTPPLLGSKQGMGSLGFRLSYADNFGVLARGANCTNAHLARLIAGVKKAGLDVHDMSLPSGSADVLGCEVSPANAYCSGTDSTYAIRTVSSRRRTGGLAVELVGGHESFLAHRNRGALSILDASFKFSQASYLGQEGQGQLCAWNRAFEGILRLFRSDWSLRWLDVCICTDAPEKGSRSRFVKDVGS